MSTLTWQMPAPNLPLQLLPHCGQATLKHMSPRSPNTKRLPSPPLANTTSITANNPSRAIPSLFRQTTLTPRIPLLTKTTTQHHKAAIRRQRLPIVRRLLPYQAIMPQVLFVLLRYTTFLNRQTLPFPQMSVNSFSAMTRGMSCSSQHRR